MAKTYRLSGYIVDPDGDDQNVLERYDIFRGSVDAEDVQIDISETWEWDEDCPENFRSCTPEQFEKRFTDRRMQKPLTLEEAYRLCETEPCVFIEDSKHTAMAAGIVEEMMPEQDCDDPCAEIHVPDTRGVVFASESLYGKRWRCWATKPTEEERRAAKWEA